jgi:hypothetical protein
MSAHTKSRSILPFMGCWFLIQLSLRFALGGEIPESQQAATYLSKSNPSSLYNCRTSRVAARSYSQESCRAPFKVATLLKFPRNLIIIKATALLKLARDLAVNRVAVLLKLPCDLIFTRIAAHLELPHNQYFSLKLPHIKSCRAILFSGKLPRFLDCRGTKVAAQFYYH